MMNLSMRTSIHLLTALVVATSCQISQAQQKGPGRGKGGGNRFADMEKKAIAEPFVGVTADGKVEKV